MSAEAKQTSKDKEPKKDKAPKAEKAAKAEKPAKVDKAAEAAAAAPKAAKVEAPRPPADPRMKVYKKFQGRFLPKGPLRDRWNALNTRWNSGEDRGGVTVEELKTLLTDWRASRAKPAKAASH